MLRRAAVLSSSLAAALAVAGPAAAQDPIVPAPAPTPPPATTPAPPPAPAPSPGTLSIRLERAGGRSAALLAGTRFRVRGAVNPYVPGQKATVRVYRGKRKVLAKQVTIVRRGRGNRGTFVVGFRLRRPGHVTVRASHRATAAQATMVARGRGLDVLPLRATPGSRGLAVRLLQQQLARHGYVVGQRGFFDARTARAVLAFRKVVGLARTSQANAEVFRRLARGQGAFRVKYPKHGRHVEADLSRQVIALINGSKVERIYPTSSGAPATPTILGSFRFYRKDPGTNALGMVHSSYFIRGYAIHGYHSVPIFNASHGCLRVPVPDALSIFRWVRTGERIDVYA